jgi:hypothetical protein
MGFVALGFLAIVLPELAGVPMTPEKPGQGSKSS